MPESIFVEVYKCPRCEQSHERLEFIPLAHPLRCCENHRYYAMCPSGEGPILRSDRPPHDDYSGRTIRQEV